MLKYKIYHLLTRYNERGESYKVLETLNEAFPFYFSSQDEFATFDEALLYMKQNADLFKYNSYTIIPEIFITTNQDGTIDEN